MNILVTGANGQLGSHIRQKSQVSKHRYFFTDVEELDITQKDAIRHFVKQNNIQAVVNCAAYTNVDRAESEEEVADLINHIAVANLAQSMAEVGGLLVHVSTDYVFGGALYNTPLPEDAQVNPTGAYGRTKLAGELAVQKSGCRFLIFRTAWLYSEYGKNFCKTMLNFTATKPALSVVFDQVGTPTYAGDLASAICTILERGTDYGNEGVYHYGNEGVCSWFDFTKEIARQAGNLSCDIQPCHSAEYPSPVVRPSYSVMDKSKFKKTFKLKIPYWTESLAVCINNLKEVK